MFENLEFKKNWAGRWSFLECCYFGGEYTKLLKDIYGVGPVNSLFTFEKGASSNYLVGEEVQAFTDVLIAKAKKDESLVFEWAKNIKLHADTVLTFVRNNKQQTLTLVQYQKLWQHLDTYLSAHFPIKKVVDYLDKELLGRVLPILEDARVYAEPVYAESLEFVKKFAEDNASHYGLTPELFLCLTRTELETENIPEKSILESRFTFSVIKVVEGNVKVYTGEEAHTLANTTIYKVNSSDTIKGTPAYKGTSSGKVLVVLDPKKYQNLPTNTVLVTGMTRPDYLHLFKEAVAVVTDAGGILSHAAITARELKIPTVIGTEVATKILKDGDMVEVDAEKGIVKIIK